MSEDEQKVSIDEICAAIKDVYEDTRAIPEPAGALAVAGMKKYLLSARRNLSSVVSIVSGANVNFDRLRHISERAEIGEEREAMLAVAIQERAGSLRNLCELLATRSLSSCFMLVRKKQKKNLK